MDQNPGRIPLPTGIFSYSSSDFSYLSSDMPEAPAQKSPRLVAHSSKIEQKNGSDNTPLHVDFQFNHMMLVEFLLGKGADPTMENKARLTPSELTSDLGTGDQFEGGGEHGRQGGR